MWVGITDKWVNGWIFLFTFLCQCLREQRQNWMRRPGWGKLTSHLIPWAELYSPDLIARGQNFVESQRFIPQPSSPHFNCCSWMKHHHGLSYMFSVSLVSKEDVRPWSRTKPSPLIHWFHSQPSEPMSGEADGPVISSPWTAATLRLKEYPSPLLSFQTSQLSYRKSRMEFAVSVGTSKK